MANFFIRRPIVAIVIAILMVLLGVFTLTGLSFEQYPFLAPPTIRVTATALTTVLTTLDDRAIEATSGASRDEVEAIVQDLHTSRKQPARQSMRR